LTWWRTGSAFDSRPQGCGFDSLSRQTFCFLYLCAQAFSASLKRSLNLSANKHYYSSSSVISYIVTASLIWKWNCLVKFQYPSLGVGVDTLRPVESGFFHTLMQLHQGKRLKCDCRHGGEEIDWRTVSYTQANKRSIRPLAPAPCMPSGRPLFSDFSFATLLPKTSPVGCTVTANSFPVLGYDSCRLLCKSPKNSADFLNALTILPR
jgi:hypothetical protein